MQTMACSPEDAGNIALALQSADAERLVYEGGELLVPSDLVSAVLAIDKTKTPTNALIAYANGKQWAIATGGFTATVAGTPRNFATDTISQGLMEGKVARLGQANPPTSFDWQFETGFVTIAAADFLSAAIAVADFVQATFSTLKTVLAAIQAGTVTTTAGIDAASWPVNHQ
jgi:hypothetical protein